MAAALNAGLATKPASAFTVLTVTNNNDSGPGSLRDAINNANTGYTIMFNLPAHSTITLTSGELLVEFSGLTITGPGADELTISGNNSSRILHLQGVLANVTVSGVTFANGFDAGPGGGIVNDGVLSLAGCTLSANSSGTAGGAISSSGTLTVMGCTFAGNSAPSAGAVISSQGCSFFNSTFSANSATNGPAGAVGAIGTGATIVNCTIAGNSATTGGGAGLLVETSTSLLLVNTIIAGNMGGDCSVAPSIALTATNDHNLIGDGSFNPMLSGDPKLGPLQNNGGSTSTMALLPGSPAVDAGDDSVLGPPLSLTTDQRGMGFPRKAGAHVDIGAFEFQPPPAPTFDTCLKDNTTGNLLQWNSTTGQYLFTRCSDNFTLSGTGTVALVNGIRTLTDMKPDRRISAGFNTGQLTGNATLYLKVAQGVWQTFRVFDTNPSAACKC
jgi:predicted outer membrane repeat protein